MAAIDRLFQSLSGVLDVCNGVQLLSALRTGSVSIPFRGFRCLQPDMQYAAGLPVISFNPFQGF